MTPPCGTKAAITAHLAYGEPLDGPCAAADAAMRLEAERRRPYRKNVPIDTPQMCAERRAILTTESRAWEAEHKGFTRHVSHLRAVA